MPKSMQLVYLESSLDDIDWMRLYYRNIFPAGKKQARLHIKATEKMISNHPQIGELFDEQKNVRELPIINAPFSFLYRINEDRIEILRLWDQRGNPDSLKMSS